MLSERRIQIGDADISFVEGPIEGTPLVMLHGITSRWQYFLPIIPSLLCRHHLFALDTRGHGRSSRVPRTYRLTDYSRDVLGFVERESGRSTVLYGHSYGALMALIAAAIRPDGIRAVILEDPPLFLFERLEGTDRFEHFKRIRAVARDVKDIHELRKKVREIWPNANEGFVRARSVDLQLFDPEVMTCVLDGRALEKYEPVELLRSLRVPMLLLQADTATEPMEPVLRNDEAQLARTLIADCVFVRFEGTGHTISRQKPAEVSLVVQQFLEAL